MPNVQRILVLIVNYIKLVFLLGQLSVDCSIMQCTEFEIGSMFWTPLFKEQMMGVDDFQTIRQTLDNLEYYDELDLVSLPLIKNILKDLQNLSKHCAEIELENEELKKRNLGSLAETSKPDPLNDTYLLEVVDSAKNQIETLQLELSKVKYENEKLKESTVCYNPFHEYLTCRNLAFLLQF